MARLAAQVAKAADAPDAVSRRVRAAQSAAGGGDAGGAGCGGGDASDGRAVLTADAASRGDELGAAAEAGVRCRDRALRPLQREARDHREDPFAPRADGVGAVPGRGVGGTAGGGAGAVVGAFASMSSRGRAEGARCRRTGRGPPRARVRVRAGQRERRAAGPGRARPAAVGSPRWARMARIEAGSVRKAIRRVSPWQRGQQSGRVP